MRIDVDDLLDRLSISAITLESYAEDCAADTPKINFSTNKILGKRFFDDPSDGIRGHLSFYLLG